MPHAEGRDPGWLLSQHLFLQAIGGNCFLLGEKLGFPEPRSQKWATASEQRASPDRRGRQRAKEGQEEAGAQATQGHCCSLPHSTSYIQPDTSEEACVAQVKMIPRARY